MKRGHTALEYKSIIRKIRAIRPDISLSSDFIVGFPGETEDDFERTLEVAAEVEYDSAYTFVFSPRGGTEAADMEADFCDPAEVTDRYERLRVVTERSARQRHAARIGKTEEVVVEGTSKRDDTVLTGRTRQNKLIHFPTVDPIKAGSYATVKVTGAGMQYLTGELVEVTSLPKRRTRIAVVPG